jgi:hypothetical protein
MPNKQDLKHVIGRLSGAVLCALAVAGCSGKTETSPIDEQPATDPFAGSPPGGRQTAATRPLTPSTAELAEWRRELQNLTVPTAGCYEASYPNIALNEVPCLVGANPPPMRPALAQMQGAPGPQQIGNGVGFGLQASTAQNLLRVQGDFTTVDGLTTLSGPRYKSNCSNPEYGSNHFSYQLNTGNFNHASCPGGLTGVPCAWQQFVFNNDLESFWGWSAGVFIQYWLIGISSCPSGWKSFDGSCYKSTEVTGFDQQTQSSLPDIGLQGLTENGRDTLWFWNFSSAKAVVAPSGLGLWGKWRQADFNVFGQSCGAHVDVPGAVIGNRLQIVEADTTSVIAAPVPFQGSSTGETNSMNVVPGSVCSRPGALEFLQVSPDRSPPPAPYCFLNAYAPQQLPFL